MIIFGRNDTEDDTGNGAPESIKCNLPPLAL
jgi:hypothetical protein